MSVKDGATGTIGQIREKAVKKQADRAALAKGKNASKAKQKAMMQQAQKNRAREEMKKEEKKIRSILFINSSNGAGYQGHNALIFKYEDGQGTLYSYNPSSIKGKKGDAVTGIQGEMRKKAMSALQIKLFMNNGLIRLICSYDYVKKKEYDVNGIEKYDRYIELPIETAIQGMKMLRKAEKIYKSPGKYKLVSHSCNFVAQEILKEGNLNFTNISGSDDRVLDELGWATTAIPLAVPIVATAYVSHRLDGTIPNGAYDIGVEKAKKNGWKYGKIGK